MARALFGVTRRRLIFTKPSTQFSPKSPNVFLARPGGGALCLDEFLSDHILCDLHLDLYGDIWTWPIGFVPSRSDRHRPSARSSHRGDHAAIPLGYDR
jgi:hypothetical protein